MEYSVRILTVGNCTRLTTELVHLPELPDELKKRVDLVWAQELAKNPKLTPGPLLSARKLRVSQAELTVEAFLTSYPNFMGTTNGPDVPPEYRHNAFSALCVTISADNQLMAGVRSEHIDWPGLYHAVPACRVTPQQATAGHAIVDEYYTELGLRVDPTDVDFLGLVEELTWGRLTIEAIFLHRSRMSADEIITAAQTAKSRIEHAMIGRVPWQPNAVHGLLVRNANRFVPTGWAGINLAAARSFGEHWEPIEWTPTPRTYDEHMALARKSPK